MLFLGRIQDFSQPYAEFNAVRHVDHKLHTSSTPFEYDIVEGKVPGYFSIVKPGVNEDLGVTLEVIASQGGTLTYLSAAEILKVKSTDVNDVGTVAASGTATGGSQTTLEDSGADFIAAGITNGDAVVNDTRTSVGIVISVETTKLTVNKFICGEDTCTCEDDAYRVIQAASTGAALVEISGVDDDYFQIKEFVVMNGTTAVSTTKSFLRANIAEMHLAGASGFNEGNININDNADVNTLLQVAAQNNRSTAGYWTVPAGHTLYIVSFEGASSSDRGSSLILMARPHLQLFQLRDEMKIHSAAFQKMYRLPLRFEAKTDIELRGKANLAGDNVSAGFVGWYKSD